MLSDITIGKYYKTDSIIHRLDPRVKIIWTLQFMVIIISLNRILLYVPVILTLLMIIITSKVPFKTIIKTVKSMTFLIAFTFVLNIIFTSGDEILKIWIIKITKEGLYLGITMAIRLAILVVEASLLMHTTTPIHLSDGIEKLLSPLKKIGLPTSEIAMMMTISLRFIPTLIEETDKIMKAQISRGADFESKNFISRAKGMIPLLVPLFISAFRRADELAIAMESRCYHSGEGKTHMKEIRFKKEDFIAFFIMIAFLIFMIVLKRMI